MKSILLMTSLFTALSAQAHTLHTENDQMFVGQEEVNEHATGNICYVRVDLVEDAPARGHFCKNISAQFLHNTDKISKDPVLLYSRVTNNHRAEYPKVKTCVENINGTSYGNEIYGDNDEILYNPFFSAANKDGMTSYDYFLSISPETKNIVRSRVHIMSWFSETNIDCVNLKPL